MSDTGKISDGYHTFDELYDHRCHLFVALMLGTSCRAWRSKLNSDGSEWPCWFVAGIDTPAGQITYHLPMWMWGMLSKPRIETLDRGEWDGHTPADVVERLAAWIAK